MTAHLLPELPSIAVDDLERGTLIPTPRIRTEEDVVTWKTTKGYQNYLLFLHRLNESVVGHIPPLSPDGNFSTAIKAMVTLLDRLDTWIDEIPPLPTPQRFGNLAFRTWGKRLEDNASDALATLLPTSLHHCIPLLTPYLVTSFGSFTRMDYGTGHEAAFGLLLLCLTLIRFFQPVPDEERCLALVVFERYLKLCWKLQDVYRLEPAGSHGVWGLDDYSFLGYIFGSGQLRDQTTVPVSSILDLPLPPTNLYYLSISRIHEVKKGPFHEHSPQLYSIAVSVPNWGKVNSGLFKMYEAEVLGKRVVVQHIPLGGLLEWNTQFSPASHPLSSGFDVKTPAPWAAPHPPSINAAGPLWTSSTAPNRQVDWGTLSLPKLPVPSTSRHSHTAGSISSSQESSQHGGDAGPRAHIP